MMVRTEQEVFRKMREKGNVRYACVGVPNIRDTDIKPGSP